MYFVDRSEIERTITHIDKLLEHTNGQAFQTTVENLALERIIHVVIESILDVGNMMIDGFIMRDPGSYHDIIDILVDEKVIPEQAEESYKAMIDLRDMLVKEYLTVDHHELKDTLNKHKPVIAQFSKQVRTYLNNELGVAHAFSNE